MATHYLNSKGQLKPIAEMVTDHLRAAHAKLLRDDPGRSDEIASMAVEIARRNADPDGAA